MEILQPIIREYGVNQYKMAIIIHPKKWNIQPPAGAQIDFGHPLAAGLTFYVLPVYGGTNFQALLPKSLGSNTVGTVPTPATKTSTGGITPNLTANWSLYYTRGKWVEPNWITIAGRARKTGTVAQDSSFFRKAFNNGTSSPFASYGLSWNSSNVGQDSSTGFFTDQTNTIHQMAVFSAASGALSNIHDYAMTVGPSGGNGFGQYFFDGIQRESLTVTGMTGIGYDTTSTGNYLLSGNDAAANGAPITGEIYWNGVWNRPLSVSEIQWLHVEPYALLIPTKRKKFFLPLASRAFTFYVAAEKII